MKTPVVGFQFPSGNHERSNGKTLYKAKVRAKFQFPSGNHERSNDQLSVCSRITVTSFQFPSGNHERSNMESKISTMASLMEFQFPSGNHEHSNRRFSSRFSDWNIRVSIPIRESWAFEWKHWRRIGGTWTCFNSHPGIMSIRIMNARITSRFPSVFQFPSGNHEHSNILRSSVPRTEL